MFLSILNIKLRICLLSLISSQSTILIDIITIIFMVRIWQNKQFQATLFLKCFIELKIFQLTFDPSLFPQTSRQVENRWAQVHEMYLTRKKMSTYLSQRLLHWRAASCLDLKVHFRTSVSDRSVLTVLWHSVMTSCSWCDHMDTRELWLVN